ncbi:TPA_asm: LPXTG cell wall anchor domain-containing protein [Listeria innocua]|nr:LPXTG cell wall anchor domain-containing protein [Listeria innocua]HAA0649775.1 LPXTG cell wall anchor domain-containing protein [Listeria innocua]
MPKLSKTGDKSPLIPSLVGMFFLSSAIVFWRKNHLKFRIMVNRKRR